MPENVVEANQALLDDLEMIISCPVCMEMLENSRMLDCGHTLCASCLALYRNSLYRRPIKFSLRCPVCRTLQRCSDGVRKNFVADQVSDRLRREKTRQLSREPIPVLLTSPSNERTDETGSGARLEVPERVKLVLTIVLYTAFFIAVIFQVIAVCEGLQSDDGVFATSFTRLVRRIVCPHPVQEEENEVMHFIRQYLLAQPEPKPVPCHLFEGLWESLVNAITWITSSTSKKDRRSWKGLCSWVEGMTES